MILKHPLGLSLSKPRAALRQAQRERFNWIHADSIVRTGGAWVPPPARLSVRRYSQRYLSLSSAMPLSAKRAIESPASASTRRFVAKRLALSENMKPSGVSQYHLATVGGLKLL